MKNIKMNIEMKGKIDGELVVDKINRFNLLSIWKGYYYDN